MTLPILMTCHNRLEFTKKSLKALVENTRSPFSLMIWDNASTDGTREYLLKNWSGRAELVLSNKNLGLTPALNTFWKIYAPRAAWLGNVDNDTIVPPAWDTDLILAASMYDFKAIQGVHPVLDRPNFFEQKEGVGEFNGKRVLRAGCIGASGAVFNSAFIYENGLLANKQMFDATEKWFTKGHAAGAWYGFAEAVRLELQDMNAADSTRKSVYPEYDKRVEEYREANKWLQ